jgi:hypothetical protein
MSRMYKDAQIEVDFDDVMEYITDYASALEINEIRVELGEITVSDLNTGLEGSYVQEEKMILLELAAQKYSLEELEEKLGNKFDLI